MKKALKIVFGVVGALGIGLVGLILACHFNPGLSDSIAGKIYKGKIADTANSSDPKDGEDSSENNSSDDTSAVLAGDGVVSADMISDDGLQIDPVTGEIIEPTEDTASADANGAGGVDASGEDVVMVPATFKTLEDYGLTQENVINSLQDYFEDCFKQLSKAKGKDTSFYNVVRDEKLADEVLASYDNDSYRAGFMDQFMDDYKVSTCGWNVDTEVLQAGYVLITHSYVRGEEP